MPDDSFGKQLTFPADTLPEAWLMRYDNTPVLLPRMPESDKMALVIVLAKDMLSDENDSVAYLVQTSEELDAISKSYDAQSPMSALCFVVPKKPLLPFMKEENGI